MEEKKQETWKQKLALFVGSCFWAGLSPFAPGTVAALWGVINYLAIMFLAPVELQRILILVSLMIWSALTVILAPWAENYYGECDSGHFVTDEVAGFLTAALLFQGPEVVIGAAWLFVTNRAIDIIKIFPANLVDKKMHNGWGVLLDDIIAGIYAAGLCHLLYYLWPKLFDWAWWLGFID